MRLIPVAVIAVVVPLFVTACASASSSTSAPDVPASSASVSPSGPTASLQVSGGGNAFAALTAGQIISRASAAFKAASSVRLVASLSGGGVQEHLTVRLGRDACAGTMSVAGTSEMFVEIGKTFWVKVAGSEYIKSTVTNAEYADMAKLCAPAEFAGIFAQLKDMAKGTTTEISGQRVQQLTLGSPASAYVTISVKPEFVRVDLPGQRWDFSAYNAAGSIKAPPASEVVGY
ncbi:MAG: hypothetical protein ACRDOE_10730 [Streptosporangiaceae bacterium]